MNFTDQFATLAVWIFRNVCVHNRIICFSVPNNKD